MSFRDKISRFMYGRYGNDKLNIALVVLFFVIWFINLFVNSLYLYLLALAVVLWQLYRTMSKSTLKRQKENAFFMRYWSRVSSFFKYQFRRIKEIKTNRYRKCPQCKSTLRLPRKSGKHTVNCPKCKSSFSVRILF